MSYESNVFDIIVNVFIGLGVLIFALSSVTSFVYGLFFAPASPSWFYIGISFVTLSVAVSLVHMIRNPTVR